MKTLHLHIGYPKTGTTSMQVTLYNNQELLHKYDFGLFNTRPDGKEETVTLGKPVWVFHNVPFYCDHCFNGATHYKLHEIIEKERLAKFLFNIPYTNVICTSEFFTNVSQSELEALYPILKKYFNSIIIYVYIRRQDRQAISLAQQNAHGTKQNNYELRALRPLKNTNSYYEKLQIYSKIFGKENMRIRVFEKDRLIENDAVIDFYHTLGLAKLVPHITIARENESLGFERTKVGHLINYANITPHLKDFLRIQLDNTGKSLPSKKEAEDYYAQFREGNILLNKEFNISPDYEAIFNDDFSDYPLEPEDIWTEEKANKAILNILNSLPDLVDSIASLTYDIEKTKHLQQIAEYQENRVKMLTAKKKCCT